MHESIATACYRGQVRRIEGRSFDASTWKGAPPRTRGEWLRTIARFEQSDPRLVLFYPPRVEGTKKDAVLHCVGAYLHDEERVWLAYLSWARARDFSCEAACLNVKITHHAVQRVMQRLEVPAVREALCRFKGLTVGLHQIREPREVLFPVVGGVAVCGADERDPEVWVVKTVVRDDQLRPEQVREAQMWLEKAAAALEKRPG